MVNLLFWNIHGKRLGHLVRALVDEHDVDIVVLAELGETPWEILPALNAGNARHVFHMNELLEQVTKQRRRQPHLFWRFDDLRCISRGDDTGHSAGPVTQDRRS